MGKAARVTREQEAAIEQLTDSQAPKRASAANKLGRKPCPKACDFLLGIADDRVAQLGELSL